MAMGDDNQLEGEFQKAKGRVKKAVGELTDDERMKREGSADKVRGSLTKLKGKLKGAINPNRRKD